jgi:protein-tyrosine phosphatase
MKILMVCLGNICRSPLAEGILAHKTQHLSVEVDSAGTSAYHVGEAPDIRSIKTGRAHGINISNQRGRQFEAGDFERFDLIYAMDSSNLQNILKLARTEADKAKVKLLLNERTPGTNESVPDPYYGGDNGFEDVYRMLDEATDVILKKLEDGTYR